MQQQCSKLDQKKIVIRLETLLQLVSTLCSYTFQNWESNKHNRTYTGNLANHILDIISDTWQHAVEAINKQSRTCNRTILLVATILYRILRTVLSIYFPYPSTIDLATTILHKIHVQGIYPSTLPRLELATKQPLLGQGADWMEGPKVTWLVS